MCKLPVNLVACQLVTSEFTSPVQENTLLDNSKRPLVKMCDFGYSKHAKDSLPKSKVGTPGYTGRHSVKFPHSDAQRTSCSMRQPHYPHLPKYLETVQHPRSSQTRSTMMV